jgi:hypothetical protein
VGRTWTKCWRHAKFFANSASFDFLTLPAHNEALAGDELTTIALNFEWRKIVASALQFYFTHYSDELGYDNEDFLSALIWDLYTAELLGMASNTYYFALPNNKTRSNAAYADVPDSTIQHTFTKSKAKISWSNVRAAVNTGGVAGTFRGKIGSGTRLTSDSAGTTITAGRDLRWTGHFEDIPTGTPVNLLLEFACAGGGTLTLSAAWNIVVEIEEYD